jgi:hypothetical protein
MVDGSGGLTYHHVSIFHVQRTGRQYLNPYRIARGGLAYTTTRAGGTEGIP